MNPTGGSVKPLNKIIGEDGQTDYFPDNHFNQYATYEYHPQIVGQSKLTESDIKDFIEPFVEQLKRFAKERSNEPNQTTTI